MKTNESKANLDYQKRLDEMDREFDDFMVAFKKWMRRKKIKRRKKPLSH